MKITVYNPKNIDSESYDNALIENSKPESVSLATVTENDNSVSNEEDCIELM